MKRIFLVSIAMLPFLLPARSDAVIVECANCSTVFGQLEEMAKQVQQYATEVATLQNGIAMKANMITNTVGLPQQVWSSVESDIMQVRSLANAASLLTGNQGSMLNRLQSAQGYSGQAASLPANIGQQFSMWQQTLGNAGLTLGRTLGVQQGQENSYTALQAQLQLHSQTAAGQMQAIQAGNEMAALTNTQLQQIHTTLVAQAQLQGVEMAVAADRRAHEDAVAQAFALGPNVPTTGYHGF